MEWAQKNFSDEYEGAWSSQPLQELLSTNLLRIPYSIRLQYLIFLSSGSHFFFRILFRQSAFRKGGLSKRVNRRTPGVGTALDIFINRAERPWQGFIRGAL